MKYSRAYVQINKPNSGVVQYYILKAITCVILSIHSYWKEAPLSTEGLASK